jgi:hypothetical protein
VGTIAAPSAAAAAGDAITREFMEFVRMRAESRLTTHG